MRSPLAYIAISLTLATQATATVPFTPRVIDAGFHGDCKELADVDGDGLLDVAVGGAAELRWYRAPAFTPSTIAVPIVEFTTDMQSADVDGDGDPDLVVPDYGSDVLWFENPRPGGDPSTPWARHVIGAFSWAHDVEVGDVDGDGRIDVLARQGGTTIWLQTGADVWSRVDLLAANPGGEGADLGDVDRDGDLDVALNGYWLECPANPADGAAWVKREIVAGWPDLCGVRIADVDGDGRVDIVLAASESTGRLSWFQAPADPHAPGPWPEVPIAASLDFVHTFQIADVDRDGRPDVAFAEMAQSSGRRVGVFYNDGAGASWHLQVVSTNGSHNVRVGDLGGDGDLDVVGANWQGPPVEWWESGLCSPACASVDDFLVGEGLGPTSTNGVRVHAQDGTPTSVAFQAYGAARWGTNVAAASIDVDPGAEILTGPGPGDVHGPHVRGFLRDGAPIAKVSYFAYGTLKFGANVAAGTVDADMYEEIVTGPGPGSVFGPHVRGWNVDAGSVTAIAQVNFFAYGTLRFGVNVTSGDVDADSFGEMVTGPGPGAVFGPQVRGWNRDGGPLGPIGAINFVAFAVGTYGANVAAGDVDADAYAEIVAALGPGPTHPADFAGFDHDGAPVVALPGYAARPFTTLFGARPGTGDVALDAREELHAGAGRDPAASSRVVVLRYDGSGLALDPVTFVPFAGGYGVNASGGALGF